jgi:hypothetical protein
MFSKLKRDTVSPDERDGVNLTMLQFSNKVYRRQVEITYDAVHRAKITIPFKRAWKAYLEDEKAEYQLGRVSLPDKIQSYKMMRKKLSKKTIKMVAKKYLDPSGNCYSSDKISSHQMQLLLDLITSVDVTRTLPFVESSQLSAYKRQRTITEEEQAAFIGTENEEVAQHEIEAHGDRMYEKIKEGKTLVDPDYHYRTKLESKTTATCTTKTTEGGLAKDEDDLVQAFVEYRTFSDGDHSFIKNILNAAGFDFPEFKRLRLGIEYFRVQGGDRNSYRGAYNYKVVSFVAAALKLRESGYITVEERVNSKGEIFYIFVCNFEHTHGRIATINETCGKSRDVSMLESALVLYGSFVAGTMRDLLCYNPVFYEGYGAGDKLDDVFERLNSEKHFGEPLVSYAIKKAAEYGISPRLEVKDYVSATEFFSFLSLKTLCTGIENAAMEETDPDHLKVSRFMGLFTGFIRGLAEGLSLNYSLSGEKVRLKLRNGIMLMGSPSTKEVLHMVTDICSEVSPSSGLPVGLSKLLSEIRLILGDDLWGLFLNRRYPMLSSLYGLKVSEVKGTSEEDSDRTQIGLVLDRATTIFRDILGNYRILTSALPAPKKFSLLGKFAGDDMLPLESRLPSMWECMLENEASMRLIEVASMYKQTIRSEPFLNYLYREVDYRPIIYGGTNWSSSPESTEWVVSGHLQVLFAMFLHFNGVTLYESKFGQAPELKGYIPLYKVSSLIRDYRGPDFKFPVQSMGGLGQGQFTEEDGDLLVNYLRETTSDVYPVLSVSAQDVYIMATSQNFDTKERVKKDFLDSLITKVVDFDDKANPVEEFGSFLEKLQGSNLVRSGRPAHLLEDLFLTDSGESSPSMGPF